MARMIKLPGRNVSVNPYAVASISLSFTEGVAPRVRVGLTNGGHFELIPERADEIPHRSGLELYEQVVALINERIG